MEKRKKRFGNLALIVSVIILSGSIITGVVIWSNTQHQLILQKDRALKQQTDNLKYEQQQLNNRQQQRETCSNSANPYEKYGAGC